MAKLNKTSDKDASYLEMISGKKGTELSQKVFNQYDDSPEVLAIGRFTGRMPTVIKTKHNSRDVSPTNKDKGRKQRLKALSTNEKIERDYKYNPSGVVNMKYFKKTTKGIEIECHFCKKKGKTRTQYKCTLKQFGC